MARQALAALAFLLLVNPAAWADEFRARVTWVVDGDSVRFEHLVKGRPVRDECRMLHYNAPEMTGPERPEGKRALKKLISLIARREVMVRGGKRDRYGRLLCEIRLMDGTYINDLMREYLADYPKRDIYLWKEKKEAE